jgi:DNA-binding beta-propeller fold protein YncE
LRAGEASRVVITWNLTRRTLLAAALLAGCRRQLARRYFGWLFLASASERGIAVADLSVFRYVTTIPLSATPGQVLRAGNQVFVTCPEAHSLCEIDPVRLRVAGRMDMGGRIAAATFISGINTIAVVTDQPAAFHLVNPVARRVTKRIALPPMPVGLDVTDSMAAVTTGSTNGVVRVPFGSGKIAGITAIGSKCGAIRFRKNGETILVGAPDAREIVTIDAASGVLLARLPLSFAPARFCPNEDGGQMFVTGMYGDVMAIVDPYQNQVDQTIIAGSRPFGMAVSTIDEQELLFVTNPGSGDLTIFDIETRRLASSVHIGGNPGEVLITPDGQYALVIDRDSGDVAVVRVRTVLVRTIRTKPLFTFFPTARAPQSAAIIPAET